MFSKMVYKKDALCVPRACACSGPEKFKSLFSELERSNWKVKRLGGHKSTYGF